MVVTTEVVKGMVTLVEAAKMEGNMGEWMVGMEWTAAMEAEGVTRAVAAQMEDMGEMRVVQAEEVAMAAVREVEEAAVVVDPGVAAPAGWAAM